VARCVPDLRLRAFAARGFFKFASSLIFVSGVTELDLPDLAAVDQRRVAPGVCW
jgi:hypothetical protein